MPRKEGMGDGPGVCHHDVDLIWPLFAVCQGLRKVLTMLEIIVGIIGIILMVYLFVAVIRPDKF